MASNKSGHFENKLTFRGHKEFAQHLAKASLRKVSKSNTYNKCQICKGISN